VNTPAKAATASQAVSALLALGRDTLGTDEAAREAKLLLAHAAGVSPARLLMLDLTDFSDDLTARYQAFLTRRRGGEPVSHILGQRAFWTHEFEVTSDVLDPRSETETLIEAALDAPFSRVLDLGTGSGCILLTLLAERPAATGVGVDVSSGALAVAARNRATLGLEQRAELRVSDWFSEVTGLYDLIVANPPYIDSAVYETLSRDVRLFEPRIALTPGPDGAAPYRRIAEQASDYLQPQGRIIFEIGFDQADVVTEILGTAGFGAVQIRRDLGGRPRVIQAMRPG
jgi:release factor glutamine methyltransferase